MTAPRTIAAVGVGVCIAAVCVGGLAIFDPTLPVGTWPDWISAVSTAGALVAASVAGYFAYSAFKIQEKQDRVFDEERRRREDAERSHQADRVVAWLGTSTNSFTGASGRVVSMGTSNVVKLLNGSDRPVWDVVVTVIGVSNSGPIRESRELDVLPPSSDPESIGIPGVSIPENASIVIEFRDAAGLKWKRAPDGVLDFVGMAYSYIYDKTDGRFYRMATVPTTGEDSPS